ATSSDSHARLRRMPNRCEFFPGGTHCGGGAGIPPDYRRFVAVGKWMVGKSARSSGNIGSNSCAIPVLLRFVHRTSEENRTATRRNIETFCRLLTASLPLGLSDLVHWLRPKPAALAPFLSGANTSGRTP